MNSLGWMAVQDSDGKDREIEDLFCCLQIIYGWITSAMIFGYKIFGWPLFHYLLFADII